MSRFTSDRRIQDDASWSEAGDWEAGTVENVDIVDGTLVSRPVSTTPTEMPGSTIARYKAENFDGSTWTDSIGNYDFSVDAGSPTKKADAINGKPAVHFDGGSNLRRDPFFPTNAGVFAVLEVTNIDGFSTSVRGVVTQMDGVSGGDAPFYWYYTSNDDEFRAQFGANSVVLNDASPSYQNEWVYASAFSTELGSQRRVGGAVEDGAVTNADTSGGTDALIGYGNFRDRYFEGNIADIIICDNPTESDMSSVEGIFESEYSLE